MLRLEVTHTMTRFRNQTKLNLGSVARDLIVKHKMVSISTFSHLLLHRGLFE